MKLDLQEHISRLLYDHECVVVPSFGAFLTRYYPAEINHATHMMRPPSRRVHFNPSIQENDGLLAKAVSLSERITYSDALEIIRSSVRNWKQTLDSGKKLNLQGIGRLYKDESSSKWQFSPSLEVNYLSSSYGLSIFRSPAIEREAAIRKSIHKAIEKHTVVEVNPGSGKKRVAAWVPWAAVLGPVILAGVIGFSYLSNHQRPVLDSISGFPWAFFHQADRVVEETASPVLNESEKTPRASGIEEEIITPEKVASHNKKEDAGNETGAIDNIPVSGNVPDQESYHIVVGSFKDAANAGSYIARLNAEGYDAYRAPGDNRFNRVAIGHFQDRTEAEKALLSVKSNIHPSAWIYHN